jgi:Rad3-related DNA helicase
LSEKIEFIFSDHGPIKQMKSDYQRRQSQVDAASLMYDALKNKRRFILEGPCGFGKTFSYLIPIFERVQTGGNRAVIVTNGISLQEQLFYKDIPLVKEIYLKSGDCDVSYAMLKGKQNFVCISKINELLLYDKNDPYITEEMQRVISWYRNRVSMDRSSKGEVQDLGFIPKYETLQAITCLEEGECKGRMCPNFNECYYQKHKIKAQHSDIVVTNYHLLFSDLNAGGAILGQYDILVMDEAHECANIFRDFNAVKVSMLSFRNLRKILTQIFNADQFVEEHLESSFHLTESLENAIARHMENLDKYFVSLNKYFQGKDRIKLFDCGENFVIDAEIIKNAKDAIGFLDLVFTSLCEYCNEIIENLGEDDQDADTIKNIANK